MAADAQPCHPTEFVGQPNAASLCPTPMPTSGKRRIAPKTTPITSGAKSSAARAQRHFSNDDNRARTPKCPSVAAFVTTAAHIDAFDLGVPRPKGSRALNARNERLPAQGRNVGLLSAAACQGLTQ